MRTVFVDGGSEAVNRANLAIDYGPKGEPSRSFRQIDADIRKAIAGVPDMRLHLLEPRTTSAT